MSTLTGAAEILCSVAGWAGVSSVAAPWIARIRCSACSFDLVDQVSGSEQVCDDGGPAVPHGKQAQKSNASLAFQPAFHPRRHVRNPAGAFESRQFLLRLAMRTSVLLLLISVCHALPTTTDDFLGNWMQHLLPAIGNASILVTCTMMPPSHSSLPHLQDLSMPGTHDTLTYDLSTTTSDGGMDGEPEISKIMHDFPGLIPGSFIRKMAHTQATMRMWCL